MMVDEVIAAFGVVLELVDEVNGVLLELSCKRRMDFRSKLSPFIHTSPTTTPRPWVSSYYVIKFWAGNSNSNGQQGGDKSRAKTIPEPFPQRISPKGFTPRPTVSLQTLSNQGQLSPSLDHLSLTRLQRAINCRRPTRSLAN